MLTLAFPQKRNYTNRGGMLLFLKSGKILCQSGKISVNRSGDSRGTGKNKMDLSKYQYIWGEEKPDWALVNSPYGYGIVNIRTQMMLMISDDELEKALIRKMEESGNAKYDSIVDAFELNREVH